VTTQGMAYPDVPIHIASTERIKGLSINQFSWRGVDITHTESVNLWS